MHDLSAKAALRSLVRAKLRAQAPERDGKSAAIWSRLSETPFFQQARTTGNIMVYLDFEDEVRTTPFLPRFLDVPQTAQQACVGERPPSVLVPCCVGKRILPLRIEALDELEPGRFGILEPRASLRNRPERRVSPDGIRLVLVPGLAFDADGRRLGRGKGYYDRFLAKLRRDVRFVALAFECQMVERVPVESHDRPVGAIVTEGRVIVVGEI